MAKKADLYYFENFQAAAGYACDAANYLLECLRDYQPDRLKTMLETMHGYEHAGDKKKHEVTEALAKAFITPVDREDLALISQNIDEVSDGIEEVLQVLYMYRIPTVTPEAVAFAEKLVECCDKMQAMLGEFANFKKPEKLHKMIIELNTLEEECDVLYLSGVRHLDDHFAGDVLSIISWRDIFKKLEACADACEHVGDCVEMVVMKNS